MAVSPALTTDERTALAGASTVLRYLSPIPDTTVATARINQASFTYPIAQITVDGTSGGWANVAPGMTIYVGSSAGANDKGIYRVRKAGNSTTLYIGEISGGDPGLLPEQLRTVGLQDNDYITVLERFDLWSVLPRINPTTGVIYEDYDLTPGTYNTTPPPLCYIYINNRRNHLFDYITTSTLAITAVASVVKWPTSSGSTVSYSWTVPGAWTGVSGSSTATLTANAPPGNYILRCTITDSIGGTFQRVSYVNVHDYTANPPLLISNMPRSDTRDRVGRRMAFDLYNDKLTALPDGAAVGYFEVDTWNGTDVPTATRQFVGWIQRITKEGDTGLRQASIEIISPAHALGLLNSTSQVITKKTSPTTWQQAVPSLMSSAFMAWYMLQWRCANVLRLFNFTVFSTAVTGQRLPQWQIDKGTILNQIQQLMTDRGNFGCNSEGEFFFLRLPQMVAYASRSDIVTRDTLDASIYTKVSITQEQVNRVSQVRGEAFSWDGAAAQPTPYYSDAPFSPGQGGAPTKLLSQVVTDQSEHNQLTGDYYALKNNKYPAIATTIQRNRDVYEPAELPFVQITIPDYLNPDNVEFVIKGVPQSVNKAHNQNGTSDIELTMDGETTGVSGGTVPVPIGNTGIYTPPYTPPVTDIPTLPNLGDWSGNLPTSVQPTDPASTDPSVAPGKGAIRNNSARVYRTYDVTQGTSTVWDDVTPADITSNSYTVVQAIHDVGHSFSRGAYVLATDSTNSYVYYTPDVYATTPTWNAPSTGIGVYQQIVSTRGVDGEVYIKGGIDTPPTCAGVAEWVVFQGTVDTVGADYVIVTSTWDAVGGAGIQLKSPGIDSCCHVVATIEPDSPTAPHSTAYVACGLPQDFAHAGTNDGSCCNYGVSFTPISVNPSFNEFKVRYTLSDGIGCTDIIVSQTRRSPDYGATFEAARTIDAVSNPGFDVGRAGLAALVGGSERVAIAHDGGTYSTETRGGTSLTGTYPICIKIPDLRNGSSSLTNISAEPSYIFATAALVSGEGFFKVISSRSAMTPSVSGNKAVGATNFGMDMWRGKRIMAIGDVDASGTITRYIFVSKSTGAAWTHTTHSNALSVRFQRFSTTGNEAISGLGADGCVYTKDCGMTWGSVTSNSTIYAEIYG